MVKAAYNLKLSKRSHPTPRAEGWSQQEISFCLRKMRFLKRFSVSFATSLVSRHLSLTARPIILLLPLCRAGYTQANLLYSAIASTRWCVAVCWRYTTARSEYHKFCWSDHLKLINCLEFQNNPN